MLTLDEVARWVTRNFWRKTDRIVARAGVTFGTDSTVLDNYVESTWTPVITCTSGTITTLTYTTQLGKYIRIGNVVFYSLVIEVNTFTIGSGSGELRVSIPLTCAATIVDRGTGSVYLNGIDLAADTRNICIVPTATQTYAVLVETNDNAASSIIAIGSLSSGDDICASGFYYV